MLITHLGHAAVLLETGDRRILFDPGAFSDAWHSLSDLDAIVVTHEHVDHIDPDNIDALLDRNPQAGFWAEAGALATHQLSARARPLPPEASVELGGVHLRGVGGLHAVIHRDIPRIGNVGLVVSCEGEPTFFHPGDSLDVVPAGVDVVAVPMMGPWAAMKEQVDFLRYLKAPRGFGIHERLLSERGWGLAFNRYQDMTPTEMADLRSGEPWDPGLAGLGQ
ncbi:MAG: MBL fold metallo-hydrolase [Propioniciclava sp.]